MILAALADAAKQFSGIQQHFARDRGPWVGFAIWVALGLLSIAFLLAAVRHYRRWDERSRLAGSGRPWLVFVRLLWSMPLTFEQRRVLISLARKTCPDAPAAILMTPGALLKAALSWAGGQDSLLWNSHLGAQLEPISHVLFNQPLNTK